MSRLDVTVAEKHDQGVHLSVDGELDISTAQSLVEALDGFDDEPLVVLDLRGVTFLDSTGLRVLIEEHQRLRDATRRLVLVEGDERVQRVFRITRTDSRFDFVHDPGEAFA